MKFTGLFRVKNEARWIGEAIRSILPLCSEVFVLDDHSIDDTKKICSAIERVTVLDSPFDGFNEARDKTWLTTMALASDTDWFLMLDGDEVLERDGAGKILSAIKHFPEMKVLEISVLYYWNNLKTLRVDGSFSRFRRASAFRAGSGLSWKYGDGPAMLHCGSIPSQLAFSPRLAVNVAVWHYGYLEPSMRREKYERYSSLDPENPVQGDYRHVVQGDSGGPGAEECLSCAGPLKLISVDEYLSGPEGSFFTDRPK